MPFCSKCGAEVPDDSAFCPKCGNQMAATPAAGERAYTRRERSEKREKGEKEEKHEKGEKSTDKTQIVVGGLFLIWLGISLYLVQTHYTNWDRWWPYFVIGIGLVLIVQGVIRYSTLRYRGAAMGSLIGGAVLSIIGLGGIMGMEDWWPFIIIAIGVLVILGGLTARMHTPKP